MLRSICLLLGSAALLASSGVAGPMYFSAYSVADRFMPLAAEHHMTSVGPYYGADMVSLTRLAGAENRGLGFAVAIPKHPDVVNDTSGWVRDNSMAAIPEADLRSFVRGVMDPVREHPSVTGWHITPEELRPWRAQEMRYLEIVADEVRRHDPLGRPVIMYNPNHRSAAELTTISNQGLDWTMMGVYITNVPFGHRAVDFVRRAARIVQAAEATGTKPVPVFELARDFNATELAALQAALGVDQATAIRQVIRNDVYQGLILGAQGIQVWSGWHNRSGLTTHRQQFDAYGSVATDLNGPLGLGSVFRNGVREQTLELTVIDGPEAASLPTGTFSIASVSRAEIMYQGMQHLFLASAVNEPVTVRLSGFSATDDRHFWRITNLFDDSVNVVSGAAGYWDLTLQPLDTAALTVTVSSMPEPSTLLLASALAAAAVTAGRRGAGGGRWRGSQPRVSRRR